MLRPKLANKPLKLSGRTGVIFVRSASFGPLRFAPGPGRGRLRRPRRDAPQLSAISVRPTRVHANLEVLNRTLDAIIVEHDLVGIVVARRDGHQVTWRGDFSRFRRGYVRRYLFGTPATVRTLWSSLDGAPLPKGYAQGNEYCAYSRDADGYVYGAFFLTSETDQGRLLTRQKEAIASVERALTTWKSSS